MQTVTEASKIIKRCRFIGWDVTVTKNNEIELIEGNHNPGYVSIEYFGEPGWYAQIKKWI